jgi:anthranilate synthase/aminodeoxychorismate synthase-like glutamine amidotransferase
LALTGNCYIAEFLIPLVYRDDLKNTKSDIKYFKQNLLYKVRNLFMILVIDNYDSFTYNLVQYLGELGYDSKVYRNDAITIEEIRKLNPTHIIISPGPGAPDEAGVSNDVIRELKGEYPILGVCLGHQCIGEVFGAKVVRAPYLMHGKTSKMIFDEEEPLFFGLSYPFTATRYHSLIIDKNSVENTPLKIIAWTSDNLIMGIKHRDYPNLYGVQFHPESILTGEGHKLLANFLEGRKIPAECNFKDFDTHHD